MSKTALIITVGGSYKPVLSALNELKPQHTVFICSDDVKVSGTKGSYTQIVGSGNVIKQEFSDERPSLPNIPTQAGLQSGQFDVVRVHPDEVDDVYQKATDAINQLKEQSYNRIVCNYTGGTKSMTAALVIAALDAPHVDLEFVTGTRTNINQITGDDSFSTPANVERVRFSKKYQAAIAQWQRYDYDACQTQMQPLIRSRSREDQELAQQVYIATQAFAAWDRFDHDSALQHLNRIKGSLGKFIGAYIRTLLALQTNDNNKKQAAQILDLWLNALRCAERRRYDDAMARCYRLIECSAQWLLLHYEGIQTAGIPAGKIPAGMKLSVSRKDPEKFQAGLMEAWEFVSKVCPASCAKFWQQNRSRLANIIQARNNSILAHGFSAVTREQWDEMAALVENALIPEILEHTKAVGIKEYPEQLPTRWFTQVI